MPKSIYNVHMDFIQPIFVNQTKGFISGKLGIENASHPLHEINGRIQQDIDAGVEQFLLFINPNQKTNSPDWNFQTEVVTHIKSKFGKQINLAVDVCLCSTTTDGHCCLIDKPQTTQQLFIDLGKQLKLAGADVLAPSDMQANTVKNLKIETQMPVLAYIKFRSNFYSAFRDLANSSPASARLYQLNPADSWGAIATASKYDKDGADYLMLKPGLLSLDLLRHIKSNTYKPVGVYQVSDEYLGLPTDNHLYETYQVFKRARCDFMVSYGARKLVQLVSK